MRSSTRVKLIADIHGGVDPFSERTLEGIFEYLELKLDLRGWGGHKDVFERVFSEAPATGLHVEVGTWKGRSAAVQGEILWERAQDVADAGALLCVDTWLGAPEFWIDKADVNRFRSLGLIGGWPHVYYQFMFNVTCAGLEDIIVPFPQTSQNAAEVMRRMNWGRAASTIYIDASHEEAEVAADLAAWWPILVDGGVMFGDDYCQRWNGVMSAVDRFAAQRGLRVEHLRRENEQGRPPSDYWILRSDGVNVASIDPTS